MTGTGTKFYKFLSGLTSDMELPPGISLINPYSDSAVKKACKTFCERFYFKDTKRILILGINPGRFGAGVTGVPFTDPVALDADCGIPNSFIKKRELSSRFIYDMINEFGGPEKFYSKFLLNAVCPLGFLKGTVNYNYYDSKELLEASMPLIKNSLHKQASWNMNTDVVISLGKKNASFLEAFNREAKLFGKIITLEHPRYIMQYKLKSKQEYIDKYMQVLRSF